MTRSQRSWHTWLWLILGPLIVVGLVMALSARPPVASRSKAPSTATPANSIEPATKSPAVEGTP